MPLAHARILVIAGSSRDDGNTAALTEAVFAQVASRHANLRSPAKAGVQNKSARLSASLDPGFRRDEREDRPWESGGIVSFVDLNDCAIGPYDYRHRHDADDFLTIAQAMTKADAIVFASPVYWYSMSAQMKLFFDRLTDLTGAYKPVGKALAGKPVFLIATGGSVVAPAAFEPPFSLTAQYFNMRWGGMLYAQGGMIDDAAVSDFASRIENPTAQAGGTAGMFERALIASVKSPSGNLQTGSDIPRSSCHRRRPAFRNPALRDNP